MQYKEQNNCIVFVNVNSTNHSAIYNHRCSQWEIPRESKAVFQQWEGHVMKLDKSKSTRLGNGRKYNYKHELHWLPIVAHVRHKVLLLVAKSQQGLALKYLCELSPLLSSGALCWSLWSSYTMVPYFSIPELGLCCGGTCTLEWHSSCTLECDVTGDIICVSS